MSRRNSYLPYNSALRARARELRNNATLGEVLLWRELKGKVLGCEFHRQVPIAEYIVDFFCHEHMVVIEVDGCSHDHMEAVEKDEHKQEQLEDLGVRILRFREIEIGRNPARVAAAVRDWLEENAENKNQSG